MNPNKSSQHHAWIGAVVLSVLTVGCSSPSKHAAAPAQPVAADGMRCKTTRNIQSPGPQPVSRPPRCADSVDAGKLPATAIAPIIIAH